MVTVILPGSFSVAICSNAYYSFANWSATFSSKSAGSRPGVDFRFCLLARWRSYFSAGVSWVYSSYLFGWFLLSAVNESIGTFEVMLLLDRLLGLLCGLPIGENWAILKFLVCCGITGFLNTICFDIVDIDCMVSFCLNPNPIIFQLNINYLWPPMH